MKLHVKSASFFTDNSRTQRLSIFLANAGFQNRRACLQAFPSFPPPPPTFIFWLLFHFSRGQNRSRILFLGLSLLLNLTEMLATQASLFFTVFLTAKSLSQNISITLLQISLKLHEHRGSYWRKKLPWMILEEQFPVPRYTAVSKIGNSVISLLWQLRCHCNSDHNKFSSLSNITVMAIFPKLCLWRHSLCSNFYYYYYY